MQSTQKLHRDVTEMKQCCVPA